MGERMPKIEGLSVENYRCLKNITLGRKSVKSAADALTPISVVIGKNGTGKSTLFDAFGFLADAINVGVDNACNMRGRGGFKRLRTAGSTGPISFKVYYRESAASRPFLYSLSIDLDDTGRVSILRESLKQAGLSRSGQQAVQFLDRHSGNETALVDSYTVEANAARKSIPETVFPSDKLAIATLGYLRDHPRVIKFREFLEHWYLSYISPSAARGVVDAGAESTLTLSGSNVGNVLQYLQQQHPNRLAQLMKTVTRFLPGIHKIATKETIDDRLVIQFNESKFQDAFLAQQMSDGTLKLFVYLVLLFKPNRPDFICIEEPENGLYPDLLGALADAFRSQTDSDERSQIFATTHQPLFLDNFTSSEVWVLDKDPKTGFSGIKRARDFLSVTELEKEEFGLGSLWLNNYFQA